MLGLQNTPLWLSYFISFFALIVTVIIAQMFIVPWQKRKILNIEEVGSDSLTRVLDSEKNKLIVDGLFDFLQILSAVFTSFAHGGEI